MSRSRWTLVLGALVLVGAQAGYLATNKTHLFEPRELPLWPIDDLVPFVPWMALVYLTEVPLYLMTFFAIRRDDRRQRYLLAQAFVVVASLGIFLIFPTRFPRERFPIPLETAGFLRAVCEGIRAADDASNAFPSLHAACSAVCAWSVVEQRRESRVTSLLISLWAVGVIVSTVTTKQHYAIDVVVAVFFSLLAYMVSLGWIGRSRAADQTDRG